MNSQDVAGLRRLLMRRFPTTFGGMYRNADDSVTILETQSVQELEDCAQSCLDAARVPGDTTAPVSVQFAQSRHSLRQLEDLSAELWDARATLLEKGIDIRSIGVDDRQGVVVVGTPDMSEATANTLQSWFAGTSDQITVEYADPKFQADSFHDTPPWNGEDFLAGQTATSLVGCTAGFGAHNATTNAHYMITAGHCDTASGGPFKWFAVDPGGPLGQSNYLGTAEANTFYNGTDAMRIPSPTSNIIWTGTANPQTIRTTITGWISPIQGDLNCIEGASSLAQHGLGEHCSTVA